MHPYLMEKLMEEEKRRIREVERTHWRKGGEDGERRRWRWGRNDNENGKRR
ncbi:hypothetical protein [Saccharibacillus kuerlensis]|uniref:Uncharacterized protein n=1 Tax=Saccharibacillus kuerlensis TaxID=459527 RepID=A0ABQ2KUX2_9BACL|nr:hypothetical protein [Saccharibacillus kuerlensis]GGN93519.1 hypothetical protein GCM10010969_07360 [Saccharibacillus kuerlensis]